MLVYWSVTTSIFVRGFYSDGSNTFKESILDFGHETYHISGFKTADLTGLNIWLLYFALDSNSSPSASLE